MLNGCFREQSEQTYLIQQIERFVTSRIAQRKTTDPSLQRWLEEMIEGQQRMRVDGKCAIRSGDKVALARDAANFCRELCLAMFVANVFYDRIGKDPIE